MDVGGFGATLCVMPRKPARSDDAAPARATVGTPYQPTGRPQALFDVPSYDDIADLQALFKRFADTTLSLSGDVTSGVYAFNGDVIVDGRKVGPNSGQVVVGRTSGFTVTIQDVWLSTVFFCQFTTNQTVTLPTPGPTDIADGQVFSIVALGTGDISLVGDIVGPSVVRTQYSRLEVMWHDGRWWTATTGYGGGGGGEGAPTAPVISWDATFDSVQWSPVSGPAGPTLGYGALAIPSDLGYVIDNAAPRLTVTQAVGGVQYEIVVWGTNIAGKGDSSNSLSHTWPALPAVPDQSVTLTPGNGSMTVSWSKVAGANAYVVGWSLDKVTWNMSDQLVFGDVTSGVVGDLDPKPYWFRVAARNSPITSAWSAPVQGIPNPAVLQPIAMKNGASAGVFLIDNFKSKYTYTVVATVGTASISGATVTVNDPSGKAVVQCSYPGSDPVQRNLERRPDGTKPECQWTMNRFYEHDYPCGDGYPAACAPCEGYESTCACSTYPPDKCGHQVGTGSQRQVPVDYTGEGFTKQNGEWTKIS